MTNDDDDDDRLTVIEVVHPHAGMMSFATVR